MDVKRRGRQSRSVLLDACVHPRRLSDSDLSTLRGFGVGAVLAVADDSPRATEDAIAAHWQDLTTTQFERLERAGLHPVLALGLHPRCLPARGLPRLLETLPLHLRAGHVRALGLVGLHLGGAKEEDALSAQLAFAETWNLKVVASARAASSDAVLRRLFSLLAQGPVPRSRVLVEGLSPGTVGTALALGFHAGLTLLPNRCPAERAVAEVSRRGPSRLVLASGAGHPDADFLALPRARHLLGKAGLSRAVAQRCTQKNAATFLEVRVE